MKIRSITLKLLPFIIGSFILVTFSVLVLSKVQLTKLIDKSQQEIFEEKLDVIWESLKRVDDRLQQTGLVEAYADDFKSSIITNLQNTYYRQPQINFKPIIVDSTSKVLMHPTLPAGHILENGSENLFAPRPDARGEFYTTVSGEKVWYIYREFEPWKWIVVYAVPLAEKYADVRKFSVLLFVTMFTITLLVAGALSFIITRLMRPISELTGITSQISKGNLDQPINIRTSDEIGVLANSFDSMRNAIQEQISRLSQEVSERKKIENELRDLERYLSDIINSMPSAIIGIDDHFRITQWNTNAANITGIPAAEAYNRSLDEVYPEFSEIYSLIAESMEQFDTKRLVKRERQTANGLVYEDLTIYPLASQATRGGGAVIRIDNVTKEYELEMQINHSSKMDAIGQLAGGVAHDFNNMLAGILGAAQLLQAVTVEHSPQAANYIDIIIKSSTRAADLTKKLLAFGRKGKIVSTSIDIHALIDDTIDILTRTIDKKVIVKKSLEAQHHFIVGDTSGLQNVFMNLGINASHAMSDGGELNIVTRNTCLDSKYCDDSPFEISAGEYIQIEFKDSGHGILPEHLKKIFDPFFTTKIQGKGAGLGLSAAYGTVQDHHGVISVESQLQQGTTFSILLPCSEEQKMEIIPEPEIARGVGTVLLVDDEEVIRVTGKHMLEQMGYTVHVAENGKEAVRFMRNGTHRIDVIILDMIMPVMDGKEAVESIRKMDANVKIIISSGFIKKDQLSTLNGLMLDGFIHKPYRMSELSQIMAQANRHSPRK